MHGKHNPIMKKNTYVPIEDRVNDKSLQYMCHQKDVEWTTLQHCVAH